MLAHCDLSIRGGGSLTVSGYLRHGIQSTKDLELRNGQLTVRAVGQALRARSSVTLSGGEVTLVSGGDGVHVASAEKEGKGFILAGGTRLTVTCSGDGLQAAGDITVSGGSVTVTAGGGHTSAPERDGWGWGRRGRWGDWDDWDDPDDEENSAQSDASTKGLKAAGSILISGGSVTVDSADDAIHAGGAITVESGTLLLATGDDGVHSDSSLTVTGGSVTVTASYEGLEAPAILIGGGELSVTSEDDGLNANGGSSSFGHRGGWERERGVADTSSALPSMTVTGGTVYVNAQGDGLDSNGNLLVTGGTVTVDGPSGSGNGALDSGSENGGTCRVEGGTVLAVGSASMAESFGDGSTQCSVSLWADFSAGQVITLTDENGRELARHTTAKSGSSVVFSSPALTEGGTVRLLLDGAEVTEGEASLGSGEESGWGWGWDSWDW